MKAGGEASADASGQDQDDDSFDFRDDDQFIDDSYGNR